MKIYVVIPNWNGAKQISACIDSLLAQTEKLGIIVVDNGSVDGSVKLIEDKYPLVTLIKHSRNKGFTGGVNAGIRYAIESGGKYIALLNNDAVADKKWLELLAKFMDSNPKIGIATGKIIDSKKKFIDSTGEIYTTWGLAYPRGRGEEVGDKYDKSELVFGASGAASLYRTKMLKEIGLFDKDFFAYYEDVDISFRAQLAGWKVGYQPGAIVYHAIGSTSSKIKDFTTYQTFKNYPWLLWKNVPLRLIPTILPRFSLAYIAFFVSAMQRGQGLSALKGSLVSLVLLPKKLVQRYRIQKHRKVTVEYINSIITHDLPPNAHKLRNLRAKWWHLTRGVPK